MSESVPTLEKLHELNPQQQPTYPDRNKVRDVVTQLNQLPPLVFAGECDDLRHKIAQVANRQGFILQGGDCAETLAGVTAGNIQGKLRVLLAMSIVLTYAGQVPVVKMGRIAGQYAKPRSKDQETRNGITLPAYRGDAVNGFDFNEHARTPDPGRLLDVYHASAATLNLVRAFTQGGFADLRSIHTWNANFVSNSPVRQRWEQLVNEIDRAISFMDAIGATNDEMARVDFYASHEALLLEYEQALTRIDSRTQLPYDVSGHLLWIGERTKQLDGAHVALAASINNPIGIKVGPTNTAADILALADRIDPDRVPGRLTLISRMGATKIRENLPPIIEGIEASGRQVAWICDPMHGNTFETSNGYKTRDFARIIEEVDGFFDVHDQLGTWPGGLHIELTGDDVTECVGGAERLNETDLTNRYETLCDPRLNRNQSLELAFYAAERLQEWRIKHRVADPIELVDFS